VYVDLDALSECFPELAKRKWLSEHFHQPRGFAPQKHARRMGNLYLHTSHFYYDPDAWGYMVYLSLWFPDRSTFTSNDTINPARLLYITSEKDQIHDFGEFPAEHKQANEEEGKVFISYVSEDAALVTRLIHDLQEQGITVWHDKNSILPGEHWPNAIRNAIHNGTAFVACFSSSYAKRSKTYMNEELLLALAEMRQMPKDRVWFIPVLISPCKVPDYEIGPAEPPLGPPVRFAV
jgi:hypothetical protein